VDPAYELPHQGAGTGPLQMFGVAGERCFPRSRVKCSRIEKPFESVGGPASFWGRTFFSMSCGPMEAAFICSEILNSVERA